MKTRHTLSHRIKSYMCQNKTKREQNIPWFVYLTDYIYLFASTLSLYYIIILFSDDNAPIRASNTTNTTLLIYIYNIVSIYTFFPIFFYN